MKTIRTLVCDGGGMKGAFMAGVMAGLKENGIDYNYFDNYVGSSAGACSMAYFLTDQIKSGLRIWQEQLLKGFISWKNFKPHIDLDYLEKIIRQTEPLNIELLKQRDKKAYVALTNFNTQRADYVSLINSADPVKLLLAGAAIPNYAEPISLNGQLYYDGGLTSQLPLEFTDSLTQDEIWVIMNRPKGYRVTTLGWKMLSYGVKNKQARRLIAEKPKKTNDSLIELEGRKDLIIICPKSELPTNWITTNKNSVNKSIELGRIAAEELMVNKKTAQV